MFKINIDKNKLLFELKSVNSILNPKNVYVVVLNSSIKGHIIYAYRRDLLYDQLKDESIRCFLYKLGYNCFDIKSSLESLKNNFQKNVMPHEIGIFLNYPLEDVIGFIDNEGKCSKCVGCWKSYGNKEMALRSFMNYNKCREDYIKSYNSGISLSKLTVNS